MNANRNAKELTALERLFPQDQTGALRFVGHQIGTIDNMGQALMQMSGILLAITTALLPTLSTLSASVRIALAAASSLVLASALCNAAAVFRVAWISHSPSIDCSTEYLLERALDIRNQKTRAYHASLALMLLALIGYLLSIYLLTIRPFFSP